MGAHIVGTLVAHLWFPKPRYCGKLSGLYPKDDDWAAAKIDEIIDVATDITLAVTRTFGMGEAEKLAARAALGEVTLPMYFKALEQVLTENGSTGSSSI